MCFTISLYGKEANSVPAACGGQQIKIFAATVPMPEAGGADFSENLSLALNTDLANTTA